MSDKLNEYKNYDELLKAADDTLNSINVMNALDKTSVDRTALSEFNNLRNKINETRAALFKYYIRNKIMLREKLKIETKFPNAFEIKFPTYSKLYSIIVFGEKICDAVDMLTVNYNEFDNYLKMAEDKLAELSDVVINNFVVYNNMLKENVDKINQYINEKNMHGRVEYKVVAAVNSKNSPILKVSLVSIAGIATIDTVAELSLVNLDMRPFLETLDYENVIKEIYDIKYEKTQSKINKYINDICEKNKFAFTKFEFDIDMNKKFDFRTGTVGPNFKLPNDTSFESEFISVVSVINHFVKYKPLTESRLELNAGSEYFYIPIYECKLNGDNYTIYDTKAGKKAILQVYKNGIKLGVRARRKTIKRFLELGRKLA